MTAGHVLLYMRMELNEGVQPRKSTAVYCIGDDSRWVMRFRDRGVNSRRPSGDLGTGRALDAAVHDGYCLVSIFGESWGGSQTDGKPQQGHGRCRDREIFGSSHWGAVRKRDDNRLGEANECLVD
jgi:hypothetical protein